MRILVLFLIIIHKISFSQVKDIMFYKQDFTVTDTVTKNQMIKTQSKKNKLVVTTYDFINNKWDKSFSNKYKIVSDTIYINKDLVFNENTFSTNTYTIYKVVISKISDALYEFKEFNYDNKLLRTGFCKNYFPLALHGKVTEHYLNGNISSIEKYDNNRFISSKRWMIDGSESIDNVHKLVNIMPQFKYNNLQHFYAEMLNSVKYPLNLAKEKYIDGACIVEFIIKDDGSIDKLQIVQKSGFNVMDYQLVKFVQTNDKYWVPGELLNTKVNYLMRIIISFQSPR